MAFPEKMTQVATAARASTTKTEHEKTGVVVVVSSWRWFVGFWCASFVVLFRVSWLARSHNILVLVPAYVAVALTADAARDSCATSLRLQQFAY